ncbi:MAG: VacB/RNase II family 3'-5' exoribonuclease [Kiritimatiellae bacterium]|nr:VacB/RNase II family 3'-5' exoribonuclease [Kiritimatiellia bacterium]
MKTTKKKQPKEELAARITETLAAPDYRPQSAAELSNAFGLKGRARANLRRLLEQMARRGTIAARGDGRYWLGAAEGLVEGRLAVLPSGNAFVTSVDGSADVFVSKTDLGTALPGDTVKVRVERKHGRTPGEGPAGRVVCVVARSPSLIVGTLRRVGRAWVVSPLDGRYRKDLRLQQRGEARENERVVVQLLKWSSPDAYPEAELVEVLGRADDPSTDTLAVIRHYGYSETYPMAAVQEAEQAAAALADPGQRRDLRDMFIFTIDPERARDFDDAISLERRANGDRVLGVHIADVSHFVPLGGRLDEEARKRATSVYFCDKVLPMIPEQLSNGICSLRPNEDRLTFSVFITFDAEAVTREVTFAKSIIRSRLRLTYPQAMTALRTRDGADLPEAQMEPAAVALLKETGRLAQQLRRRRFGHHALDLDLPEYEIVVGPDGLVSDVREAVNDESHQLIEECMIAANEAVDRELSGRGLQLLHRVHEPPTREKVDELQEELMEMGFQPGNLAERSNLAAFLKSIADHPLANDARIAVLRSMKRAVYSPKGLGHFGLAKHYYAHFTSPIRRYPDLVAHRVLGAALAGTRPPYQQGELKALGEHCSQMEQSADEAEEALLEIKKYRFLEQQVESQNPVEQDAVVVHIRSFGMFVELVHLGLQGLVHVSGLGGRRPTFDAGSEQIRSGKRTYEVGTRVKVIPARVDFERRRIDFALCGG